MPKKPGAYHRPHDLNEALRLLAQPGSVILAGGTKLLASEAGLPAQHVVDLQALGLGHIAAEDDEMTIGATATLATLAETLGRDYPQAAAGDLLREVIRREGPNTYRNAATIGGSVATRLADSELLAALLVLDAQLRFVHSSGANEINLATFLADGEAQAGLISAVRIAWRDGRWATERVARTPADYPIVAVVAWQPDGDGVRLAATGASALPRRLDTAESLLVDGLNEQSIRAAADAARNSATHPGDFRGDAEYRAEMTAVLTRRVLSGLAD